MYGSVETEREGYKSVIYRELDGVVICMYDVLPEVTGLVCY